MLGAVHSEPWNYEGSKPQTSPVCLWKRRSVADDRQHSVTVYECLLPISQEQAEAGVLPGLPWRYCMRSLSEVDDNPESLLIISNLTGERCRDR